MRRKKSYQYISPVTQVRDYECDLQGVVNHANYLHYMEHARHEMLRTIGESFSVKHDEGYDLFVTRTELDYRLSLRSGDAYTVGILLHRSGAQLVAEQDVLRVADESVACRGKIFIVGVQDGQLTRGEYFDTILELFDGQQ